MLKAIVFDFDGVIVDSEPLHYRAFLNVAERLGVRFTYEEYLEKFIGYDDRDAFRVMLGLAPGKPGSAADQAKVAELVDAKAGAFELVVNEGVEPIRGVRPFIELAAATLPIAVASGATTRDIQLILNRLGLAHRFETIVSADMVERSKPDPESYALAVEAMAKRRPELRLEPGDCLAIEDTAAGIESARGAGLMTLGLTTTAEAARLHRAMRVIEHFQGLTVDQLRAWFG
jgi:beta-phosphoglucomutase